jgi:fatty-acyl-CoA synthase
MTQFAPDLPAFHAARTPDQVVLTDADTGTTYTWAELDVRVGRVATMLRDDFGVGPGDRVGVIAENDPRVFELQFACLRLGALFVPLNWRLARPELQAIVADAQPVLLVHDAAWAETAARLRVRTLSWDDPAGYEALQAAAEPMPASKHDLGVRTHILYTSGTTGQPKGALSTHGTLLAQAMNLSHSSALSPPGHLLNPLPLFHAGGLLTVAMPLLHYGGQVTTMRRFQPDAVFAALTAPGADVSHLTLIPLMYAAIAAVPGFDEADLSSVRCGVVAGAIAPAELLAAWQARGARLQPQYGGTEMGPCALVLDPPNPEKAAQGSVGRPPMHTEVRLVDVDVDVATGRGAALGRAGEIWLRGPSITGGYWGRPTSDAFDADGWFHTGDAARVDADGYYYYAGRMGEMYKSGGENIHPAEVERILARSPEVAEIVVLGVPDERWGEVGLAVVVAKPGSSPTLESIRQFGNGRMARYKLPAAVVVVEELERNVTGKVSRPRLRELYATTREKEAAHAE